MAKKIFLIDDSEDSQAVIRVALEVEYEFQTASSVSEAKKTLEHFHPDLILLDIGLPDGSGFDVISWLKEHQNLRETPVLFISASDSSNDMVLGYSLGAEDYIVKPIKPVVLKAKMDAKFKQLARIKTEEEFSVGDVRFSVDRSLCFYGRKHSPVDLTPIEFKMLVFFARQPARVFSRNQIIDAVWGHAVHITDRTIDTHVCNIRNKLVKTMCTIEGVRGVGYRFLVLNNSQKKAA